MEGLQKPPREKAFIGMDAFTTNELSRAYWVKLYIWKGFRSVNLNVIWV